MPFSELQIFRRKRLKGILSHPVYIHEVDLTFRQLSKPVSANQTPKDIPLPLLLSHLFFFLFALEYKDNGVKFFPGASDRSRTARPTC